MSETVNYFRSTRGRILRAQIESLAKKLSRDIRILDVGGRSDYWDNVGLTNIAQISLLNLDRTEFDRKASADIFSCEVGDARDLSCFTDKSFDLVHSNSVIEHVGLWPDMCSMASEVRRVGRSGWVQTPAWEFPIEPHFRLPFIHWLGQPLRRVALATSRDYGALSIQERRFHVDRINLLSYGEFRTIFPDCEIFVERVVFAKSYVARW